MIRHKSRPPPSYHWEGFGRKNTKPPWFDVRTFDKERRDVGWVVKDFAPPGTKKVSRKGAAPFVHDDNEHIYRPTVPSKGLAVEAPATPSSRALLSRNKSCSATGFDEIGTEAKLAAMKEASRHSRLQMLANVEISQRSELGETICGRGESIKKPLLYPQTVTHQQALNLEKKAGPRAPVDDIALQRKPPTTDGSIARAFEPWNQHMYLPYSRTRSDFPNLA